MKTFTLIIFTFLFACISSNFLSAQFITDVETKLGLIFFDSRVAKGDYFESSKGWGSQADLNISKTFNINRKFSPTLGLGYTNFYYWNVYFLDGRPAVLKPPYSYSSYGNLTSHYMNIRYGLQYNIFKDKLYLSCYGTNYILLHKDLQGINQNRIFMNLDLGIKVRLNKRLYFTLETPLTIHPIVQDSPMAILGVGESILFERFVEMNGIYLGIGYQFSTKK